MSCLESNLTEQPNTPSKIQENQVVEDKSTIHKLMENMEMPIETFKSLTDGITKFMKKKDDNENTKLPEDHLPTPSNSFSIFRRLSNQIISQKKDGECQTDESVLNTEATSKANKNNGTVTILYERKLPIDKSTQTGSGLIRDDNSKNSQLLPANIISQDGMLHLM